jgi:hypothetical protein
MTADERKKELKKAVEQYAKILLNNFNSKQGDEVSTTQNVMIIMDLFKKTPADKREGLLFIIFRTMSAPTGINRATNMLRDKAFELVLNLEKINSP